MNIRLGISEAFHNKTLRSGYDKSAFSTSFTPMALALNELAAHIAAGGAFSLAHFSSSRTSEHFAGAWLLGLDFDQSVSIAQCLDHPFLGRYAALLYPTPSHTPEEPKTRALLVLPSEVADRTEYEKLLHGLVLLCADLNPDAKCRDAARFFFGSAKPGLVQRDVRLDAAALAELRMAYEAHQAEVNAALERARTDAPGSLTLSENNRIRDRQQRYVWKAVEKAVERVANTSDERHNALYTGARYLSGWLWTGFINQSEIERLLLGAAVRNGRAAKVGERECLRVIRDGIEKGGELNTLPAGNSRKKKKASDTTTANDTPPTLDITPLKLPDLPADLLVEMPYISAIDSEKLLEHHALLIKSALGTGKTELVKHLCAELEKQLGAPPRVLMLTHRESLAHDIARRLEVECYKHFDAKQLRQIPQLVICWNSLYKLAAAGETLPHYDLIIFDEIEQHPAHLDGDTFQKDEALKAYTIARELLRRAGHVVGLDAHITSVSQQWLAGICGSVCTTVNTFRREDRPMTLFSDKSAVYDKAAKIVASGGRIGFACSSKAEAQRALEFFRQRVGENGVFLICGDNSAEKPVQAFIADINERLKSVQVLIYTSSLGSGVDIQTPVDAICGVFSCTGNRNKRGMVASDFHQMLGRFRNAGSALVYVKQRTDDLPTDWQAIFNYYQSEALKTGAKCEFDEVGIYAITRDHQSLLKLLSLSRAQCNIQHNNPVGAFAALADGWTLTAQESCAPAIAEELAAIGKALAAEKRTAVLTAEPVDHEAFELHRMKGTLTPEVRAGHERFVIEDTGGIEVDTELDPDSAPGVLVYDLLDTPKKRGALRTYADLDAEEADLIAADRAEAAANVPLTRRKHRTRRRALIRSLLQTAFGDAGRHSTEALTREQIEARLDGWLVLHTEQLVSLLGWRTDQSHDPVAVLRWVLKAVGIPFVSAQKMIDGQRIRYYFIEQPKLSAWETMAVCRRALQRLKAENEAKTRHYSKHVDIDSSPRKTSNPSSATFAKIRGRPPVPGFVQMDASPESAA